MILCSTGHPLSYALILSATGFDIVLAAQYESQWDNFGLGMFYHTQKVVRISFSRKVASSFVGC